MKALWPRGEASVREIQEALLPTLPRAYTTIMTILDRLAQKSVVVRQKAGKAWVYRPNLSADEARSHAVAQVESGFFDGSAEALAAHLASPDRILQGGLKREVISPRDTGHARPSLDQTSEPQPECVRQAGRVMALATRLL